MEDSINASFFGAKFLSEKFSGTTRLSKFFNWRAQIQLLNIKNYTDGNYVPKTDAFKPVESPRDTKRRIR